MRPSITLLGVLAGACLGVILAACVDRPNTVHCANLDGDATCADRHPDGTLPYCALGSCEPDVRDGCVAERPSDACAAPCGEVATGGDECIAGTGETTLTTTASTIDDSGSSSTLGTADTTSTADASSSTGPACLDDTSCGGATPFCRDGACVDCSATEAPDTACAGLNPDVPLCQDGVCVQCTDKNATACAGTTPICVASTCTGCTDHAQCPDAACHFEDGSCLPDDRVWWVDGDAGGCVLADGSMAAPFCTIGEALAEISQASRGTIRIAATAQPYSEALAIEGDRIVALLAWEPGLPELDANGSSTLTVEGATVYVQRLRWLGNSGAPAVALDDAIAWIDRSELVLNQGGGIDASGGATLHLRGAVIGAGGTGLADRQALLADGSSFDIVASTIAGNDGSGAASVRCTGGGGGSIRSSIVVALDPPSIDCAGIDVADSAVDTDLPGGNTMLDAFDADWFVDPAGGDFHLVAGTPFDDIGVWQAGDLALDLDGDPRGGRDGAVDFAGADVIP